MVGKLKANTSVSILKETRRAITAAAASWSNPEIKSYDVSNKFNIMTIN